MWPHSRESTKGTRRSASLRRDLWMFAVTALVCYSIYAIQAERARNVRSACRETNDRNRATKVIADRYGDPRSRAVVYLLVDALAPPHDCDRLVNERVALPF